MATRPSRLCTRTPDGPPPAYSPAPRSTDRPAQAKSCLLKATLSISFIIEEAADSLRRACRLCLYLHRQCFACADAICTATHPPGLAAPCVVVSSHPGSPPRAVTATLSRRDAHARSEPRLPPARTLRGSVLPIPSLFTTPPDGVDALGAAERAGRYYPRFGAERHRRAA